MNIQIIKSINGKEEYVLLPINIYKALRDEISKIMKNMNDKFDPDYDIFDPADYVDNPIALARIKAGMTQEELASRMSVSQEYISKIENQNKITPKLMLKVKTALNRSKKEARKVRALSKDEVKP